MAKIAQKDYIEYLSKLGFSQVDGVDVTHDGYPLSLKESKYISILVATGNVSKALKTSGLSYKNVTGKDYISREVAYRLDLLKKTTIADADEIMQYFTKVMRGQEKDQFGLDAPLSERTSAAKELAKRLVDIENTQDSAPEIKVTLNWEGM